MILNFFFLLEISSIQNGRFSKRTPQPVRYPERLFLDSFPIIVLASDHKGLLPYNVKIQFRRARRNWSRHKGRQADRTGGMSERRELVRRRFKCRQSEPAILVNTSGLRHEGVIRALIHCPRVFPSTPGCARRAAPAGRSHVFTRYIGIGTRLRIYTPPKPSSSSTLVPSTNSRESPREGGEKRRGARDASLAFCKLLLLGITIKRLALREIFRDCSQWQPGLDWGPHFSLLINPFSRRREYVKYAGDIFKLTRRGLLYILRVLEIDAQLFDDYARLTWNRCSSRCPSCAAPRTELAPFLIFVVWIHKRSIWRGTLRH